jgi:hypothetical protein
MKLKTPRNTKRYYWTNHVVEKMNFYGLSEQKVLGIINSPKRKEEGIVENTIAVMKPVSPKTVDGKIVWKQEIWAMYQKAVQNKRASSSDERINRLEEILNSQKQIKIISAWRYPGVSSKENPIPEEILQEINKKGII